MGELGPHDTSPAAPHWSLVCWAAVGWLVAAQDVVTAQHACLPTSVRATLQFSPIYLRSGRDSGARCKVRWLVSADTDLRQIIKVTSAAIFYLRGPLAFGGSLSMCRAVTACGSPGPRVVTRGHRGHRVTGTLDGTLGDTWSPGVTCRDTWGHRVSVPQSAAVPCVVRSDSSGLGPAADRAQPAKREQETAAGISTICMQIPRLFFNHLTVTTTV